MSCAPWGCLLCGRWIGRLSVVSFFSEERDEELNRCKYARAGWFVSN